MKISLLATLLLPILGWQGACAESQDPLAAGFANPPAQTQPWCYWYWISDNISREGITKDLEAMKRFGIGEALIGNIFLDNQPAGKIKVLSEEWWQLIEHAIREGGRIGVNIGLFNCPGWSQSGGPWVKPTQTMRYLATSEIRVTGPRKFAEKIPAPKEEFQDVAVLAFPAPAHDEDQFSTFKPTISLNPSVPHAENLIDGDKNSEVAIATRQSDKNKPVTVDIKLSQPLTARSLNIFPAKQSFAADCQLQAQEANGEFKTIRTFRYDRSNSKIGTGFVPESPVSISFSATTSTDFRLIFSKFSGPEKTYDLAEIELSGAARVEYFPEKQLAKMHPTPLPLWSTYLWPEQVEPESPLFTVPLNQIRNLSAQLAADGTLTWDVPAGSWIIQRTGMTPTGMKNSPASPEGKGLEIDKMNRELAKAHFNAFVGELLKRMPASERTAWKEVVADSYEMGSQNWTDGFAVQFQKHYGYDPVPWLPTLSGRILGSATQSDRFLWDLRRLVADSIATEYVGGMQESAKANGLGLWLENYGHWGFPSEFLTYGSLSDRIGGEFWVIGELGSIECRAASSCANTYGKRYVSAESFTGGPAFQNAPRAFKARGDWSLCEGINHRVFHVYIHQPADDKIPGINAPWGTEFNRHNTWFEQGKAWVDYERRCSWMLQQGWRAADVAYFIGEDAPKMTGERNPTLPKGCDYDYINAEVIERDLAVKNGLLVLPHGVSYRVLVLPKQSTMRPALLKKIGELVTAGATIVGEPPVRSPSMEGFPACDQDVRSLAAALWGDATLPANGKRTVGKGRIFWGTSLETIFAADQVPADIEFRDAKSDANLLFTHRHAADTDIYFVTNQLERDEKVTCAFRSVGRQPELWDAVTGEHRLLPEWSEKSGQTLIPLTFAARQSWFIVFRAPGAPQAGGMNSPELRTISTISAPWTVAFDPRWGGPAEITFTQLQDWISRPEEGIKFYSGKATYRTAFTLPDVPLPASGRCYLDLGKVYDLATVRLNGKNLGTVWTAPWRVEITTALQPGSNALEIEVVNPWNNRLVGDSSLPIEKRLTSLSLDTVKPKTPLQSAGLLGPVTVQISP